MTGAYASPLRLDGHAPGEAANGVDRDGAAGVCAFAGFADPVVGVGLTALAGIK
jgi:hypothetical protein